MPSNSNYSRQNTSDSRVDVSNDVVSVVVNDSESHSLSNSLDRSICSSLAADDLLSCSVNDEFSTCAPDADERALLEKLQHANR